MNIKLVLYSIGKMSYLLAITMVIPMLIAVGDRSVEVKAFTVAILVALAVGFLCSRLKTEDSFGRQEGFATVGLGWIIISAIGALPFFISGIVPTYTDAFFETMSGFTTTGATILTVIEGLPRGLLFWRSLTHWLGGMGIIMLSLAVFSFLRKGSFLFQAEVPGPTPDRILPRLKQTAMVLWIIYGGLSLMEILALNAAGMSLYESFIHTFGTMATGGFSSRDLSVKAFDNPLIETIICIFMILAGLNFALYYRMLRKKSIKTFFLDPEARAYLGIIGIATIIITVSLTTKMNLSVVNAFRKAVFQVVSIVTTTGFSSDNFDLWPPLCKGILFVLMFIGGCTGSTGGSIKVARVVLLFKYAKRRIRQVTRPRLVLQTKLGNVPVSDSVIHEILAFFFLYITLFIVGALIVMATGVDMLTALSASAATIGNIGPGFAGVGPLENYFSLHPVAKWTLSFLMLAGRLELLTILVLFQPSFWRK